MKSTISRSVLSLILLTGAAGLAASAAATCEKANLIANMCLNNCDEEGACDSPNYLRDDDFWALQAVGPKNKKVISTTLLCSVNWNELDAQDNCVVPKTCTEGSQGYLYQGICPSGIE